MELIERDSVFELLQAKFQNIEEGEGHCAFISGEAGMGKTSVVKAFCKKHKGDCTVYTGACDALFTPRPLAPLYDIIWQVNNKLWPDSHTIEERTLLFTSLFRELRNQKEKFLIVFEDIHWADEATLDFIKFLARRITQLRCLFILTYRDDETPSHYTVRNMLGQLPPDCFTRLPLAALSKGAVKMMAERKGYDGENVYTIAGGNPFYVTEILSSYSLGVPDSIKDAILSAYNRTDEKARQIWDLLSVIPSGCEIKYLEKLEPSYASAIESSLSNQILITGKLIAFKHELFRRTIESSLSPWKRLVLNKKILDLLHESFEQSGEIERIIHHAKNANEYDTVVHYAPLAAKKAASVGAHLEASRLYLSAIEYYQGKDKDLLIRFYEAYSYECYLTNQIKEAIIYCAKSLELWKEKEDPEKVGNCLVFLSRLWWVNDNLKKAESLAEQAIEVLKDQLPSGAKAMAFSNLSQLKMFSDLADECIFWGEKAIQMAKELGNDAVLSHAIGHVGAAQVRIPANQKEGMEKLHQCLEIALKNGYHEHVARGYTYLGYNGIIIKDYEFAKKALETGIVYCEDNNLALWSMFILAIKARLLLETGNWVEARETAEKLIAYQEPPKIIKIFALTVLATIKMRKGDDENLLSRLIEAKDKAFEVMEPQRINQALTAFLEYEWITGQQFLEQEVLDHSIKIWGCMGNIYAKSEFAFWLQKARGQHMPLKDLYEGYDASSIIKAKKAAEVWEKAGCPYNQALALFEGNDEDKRRAITIVHALQADAVYQKMKLEMRTSGIKSIPRGLRKSTQSNPALLTGRELDVLQLLQEGLQNKEIAGKLFISAKTVDHHISSILFKLDTNTRTKAVQEAVRREILQ